jgi:Zn-dependent M28 family amino/carboxypeptidase
MIARMFPRALLLAALLAGVLVVTARGAGDDPDLGKRWHEHVEFLASDAMRGRQTGSPEHLKAAEYVAAQFKALGLEPAADGGTYLQPVAFAWRRVDEPHSSLELVFPDSTVPLVLGEDATISMALDEPRDLDAPLVFAGYAVSVPEQGYDDLARADLKGKVVVHIQGGPDAVTEPRRSQSQFTGERWARLREHGAIGLITIRNPRRAEGGGNWARGAAQRFNPGMSLADADVDERTGQKLGLNLNAAHAQRWFAGSGHALEDLMALSDSADAMPAFDLVPRVHAKIAFERKTITSQNVVALLRGSDPKLAHEYVVLTGHLDHLGVGVPVAGDSVFNGAMDNASGVSSLIETARILAAKRPKRSVLFVIVTGEEKGLLGSYYWTRRPTVPLGQIAANVNVDMVLPIIPLANLVVHGVDESTLGDVARDEARAAGIAILPDPDPRRNLFIRSDQFNFIRAGVPAIALSAAAVPGSPQDSLLKAWTRDRYHEPSDDLSQPMDPAAASDLIRYVAGLTERVANQTGRPAWKDASFFKRYAATP